MHAVPDRKPRAPPPRRGARARPRGDDARKGRRMVACHGEDLDLRARPGLALPGAERDGPVAGALRAARRRRSVSAELLRLLDGFRVTQTIYAGAELGIPDLLAEGERTADDLAEASGADPSTLYRLLRALANLGIVHEGDERIFSLTELGRPLRSDVPGSVAGWVRLQGHNYLWQSWGNLANAVRAGENSFRMVHGTDIWKWRAEHADESAIFDEAMRSMTIGVNASILDAYDFGRFGTIVDVAGGNGTLLTAVLGAHPAS